MMTSLNTIEGTNLSTAWRLALDRITNGTGKEITPLLLTLTGFEECLKTREMLDAHLKVNKLASIQTVSETIFPDSLYNYYGRDRKKLYAEYLKNLHRIKKIDRSNAKGTYFQRLIAFEGAEKNINQLEIIISSLSAKKNKRRSKLQAALFDPTKDHTNGVFQGFPCLQHVTFHVSEKKGLVLNSFYAIQYLYQRGYGNWLGLINLGKFVANELQLPFERFNCFVGVEQLDRLTKEQARTLLANLPTN